MKKLTFDDIRDLAIQITDEMVNQNLIKNCIDTDCEDEFIGQDIITEILCKKFNIENQF